MPFTGRSSSRLLESSNLLDRDRHKCKPVGALGVEMHAWKQKVCFCMQGRVSEHACLCFASVLVSATQCQSLTLGQVSEQCNVHSRWTAADL